MTYFILTCLSLLLQGLHRHRQISHGGATGKATLNAPVRGTPQAPQNVYKCYICGEQVAYLATHLSEKHNLSIQVSDSCSVCRTRKFETFRRRKFGHS